MAIIGTVIDAIKAAGMGYEAIAIEPILDENKQPQKGPGGDVLKVLKVTSKPGEMERLNQVLIDANLALPMPFIVGGEITDDPWDYAFSLYNLEPHTLDDDQIRKAAGILGLFADTEEIMDHLAHNFSEIEDEALEANMTFDEAVEAKEELEREMGIKTVVMVRCEGCDGVGGWSGYSQVHGEQDAECGCCKGRGVQYLPEAE